MDSRVGRPIAVAIAATAVLVGACGVASAHDVTGSRFDAPLPLSLLIVGAGATVALTALWLAIADRPPIPAASGRRLGTIPTAIANPVRLVASSLFLVGVVAALAFGIVGRQVPAENVATVFTWPVWFRGVALLAVLFGNPWPTLAPWRTVYRGFVRLEGREVALLGAYPIALGAWPALVGYLVLVGVIENVTVVPRSPRLTAVVVAGYALAMVVGSAAFGASWFQRVDPLGVLYRLLGRVAPVAVSATDEGYAVAVRTPWQGCLAPVPSAPLVVFVVAAVYTVSFDGFADARAFQTALFAVRDALATGPLTSVVLYAVGLAGFVPAFALACGLADRLGAGNGRSWLAATRRFAPTVLPIAAAYEVAHNYPYVLGNLGRLVAVAARPIAPGIEPIEPLWWLSLPAFWGTQVVLIVGGHVIAVVAAHHVAVERYGTRGARRGHAPLVALMVGYTALSLWIVSRPVVA